MLLILDPTIRQTVIKGMLYYNIVSMFRVCFPACYKVHLVNSAFGFHLRLFTCAPYTSWTNYTSKSYLKGWVKASSQRLKTGIARLRCGNPDRRFSGPPSWGLDRRADYPTSHKTNTITKLNEQLQNLNGLFGPRPGTSTGIMAFNK